MVRLGCSASLSGEEAVHGRHMVAAVRLAVEQARGRADLPVDLQLVVADDTGDGTDAAEVALDFVGDPLMGAVVGPMTSETALAAAPIYQAGRVTHISPAASTPALTRSGYDTFFRTVADDSVQGRAAARLMVRRLGFGSVGIVHDGTSFGLGLAEIVRAEAISLGATVGLFDGVTKGRRDFTPTIERVKRVAPEVIYCGLIEAEGASFAAGLRRAGVMTPLFGADALKPSRFLETPGYPAPGPFYTSASTDVTRAGSARRFHQAFGDYSIYTAEAYDAACILIEAVRRSGGGDREDIRREAAGTAGFAGASGTITFDGRGDLTAPHVDFYGVRDGALIFMGAAQDVG